MAITSQLTEEGVGSRRAKWITSGLLAVLVACGIWITMVPGWSGAIERANSALLPVVSLGLSIFLAAFPVLICFVQATSVKRQLDKLDSISERAVAQTQYYQAAHITVGAIRPASVTDDYILPMLTFGLVTLWCSITVYMGYYAKYYFDTPNVVLGGLFAIGTPSGPALADYQRGTFLVSCMAFLGAYVYTVGRLLDRVNNNDLYPVSFHYYAAWMIIASFVACVFRHAAFVLGVEQNQTLLLIGFAIGLAPNAFIQSMVRRAFQWAKVADTKSDPAAELLPRALPLMMIDDLTREKIDRFSELGIDNAQVLSCQNPFMIWPRLPFDLGLIVDWIAQAQLYALVKEAPLQRLRAKYVFDIFDLHQRLADPAASGEVCDALGVAPTSAAAIARQLDDDQCFTRLKEVRDALAAHGGEVQGVRAAA